MKIILMTLFALSAFDAEAVGVNKGHHRAPLCPEEHRLDETVKNIQGNPTHIKDIYNQTEEEMAITLYGIQHQCRIE